MAVAVTVVTLAAPTDRPSFQNEALTNQPLEISEYSNEPPAENGAERPVTENDGYEPPSKDISEPPAEDIDVTEPPAEDIDVTEPPAEDIDVTEPPPAEGSDVTEPPAEDNGTYKPIDPITVENNTDIPPRSVITLGDLFPEIPDFFEIKSSVKVQLETHPTSDIVVEDLALGDTAVVSSPSVASVFDKYFGDWVFSENESSDDPLTLIVNTFDTLSSAHKTEAEAKPDNDHESVSLDLSYLFDEDSRLKPEYLGLLALLPGEWGDLARDDRPRVTRLANSAPSR
ncbi:hypothetical protein O3G_MSEX014578 [Manduca sexta]|uniref:Uncharacterized protein n=1 Tax=Manduca sexta TaxID=7130 RepID=A0A921ZVV7_MANSE|nr:hypothetical protein O3G_MSEX014578 [Manduca sexta]